MTAEDTDKPLTLSRHAKTRIRSRFGSAALANISEAPSRATSVLLFHNGKGEYRWTERADGDIVLVIKEDCVVSVVTLEMAFADCPQAVFLALCENGRLHSALHLRASAQFEELPDPLILGITVPHPERMGIVWSVFKWVHK